MSKSNKIVSVRAADRRFVMPEGAGSDSVHVDPVYSYAVAVVELADGEYGTGLGFTLGRGTEVVAKAIEAFAPFVVGRDLDAIMPRFAAVWRKLADESQLRWLGPQKGATHLALSAVSSALVDAWARRQGKPLWRLLLDMPPDELLNWVDLTYLTDFITRDEALALLRAGHAPADRERDLLAAGYPAYDTSVGWLGYDTDAVVGKCRAQLAAGFGAFKIKVGSPHLDQDLERVRAVRRAVGSGVRVMVDANQRWSVAEAITAGRALAELDCFWLEEPTHPDDILGHADIARGVAPLRLATGECVANAVQFKNLIRAGGIHFVQADVLRLGGLPEFLAAALMARKAGLPLAPHAGGDAGQMHRHLVLWNALRLGGEVHHLEYVPHLRDEFVAPAEVAGGRFLPPREPGASTRLVGVSPIVDADGHRPRRTVAVTP